MKKGTFEYDQNFLQKHDPGLIILKARKGSAQVLVSPKYQAKVFTSTVRANGPSFGWINYDEIASGELDPHMNAYGGENRMWLGPEGGQYSIFFPPGADFTFENWKTPPAIDSESWSVEQADSSSVTMAKTSQFLNHSGAQFLVEMKRTIEALHSQELEKQLGISLQGLEAVAYRTMNSITNAGNAPWTKESGSVCIWILDMFPPSDSTVVMVPYRDGRGDQPIVRSDYFGQVPEERLNVQNGIILFRADGKQRGKIGVPPSHATPLVGSIDWENNILTIVQFDLDTIASYLNQEWKLHEQPYQGDAVNAYNDGPLENGQQMGPFYELESVSPAAFLEPGQTMDHAHTVFHLTGDASRLESLTKQLFGINKQQIDEFLAYEK